MQPNNIDAIVLFSGPGGVSTGLRNAGITHSLGIEYEENAANTARAAGHAVLEADVASLDPWITAFNFDMISNHRELLLQASPPCQGLSKAGKGKGRDDLHFLLDMIEQLRDGTTHREDAHALRQRLTDLCSDERSPLTYEVVRWIADLDPHHVVLEQVPAALPIWEAIAELLKAWGYSVWVGNVQAEQFGVPQTRKRAILLASRTVEVSEPVPSHSKYHNRTPGRLDANVLPWVSMADALEWGMTERPYPTIAPGSGQGGPDSLALGGSGARKVVYREHDEGRWIGKEVTHMGDVYNSKGCIRSVDEPAMTMTSSMDNGNFQFFDEENPPAKTVERLAARRAAVEEEVLPRVNNQSGTEFDLAWPIDRPSPVVAGREIITMPGANANRFNGATKSRNDGIRVLDWEAGVLQSFPSDYPWSGNKTVRFQQIGNAVPPLLMTALVGGMCVSEIAPIETAVTA